MINVKSTFSNFIFQWRQYLWFLNSFLICGQKCTVCFIHLSFHCFAMNNGLSYLCFVLFLFFYFFHSGFLTCIYIFSIAFFYLYFSIAFLWWIIIVLFISSSDPRQPWDQGLVSVPHPADDTSRQQQSAPAPPRRPGPTQTGPGAGGRQGTQGKLLPHQGTPCLLRRFLRNTINSHCHLL